MPEEQELRRIVEAFLAEATDSFCEFCQKHAPKDVEGGILGPIDHEVGCPRADAEAALARGVGVCRDNGEPPRESFVAALDHYANRIAVGFLVPACHSTDYAERWKAVNRAAGAIAGWAADLDPDLVDQAQFAQALTDACLQVMNDRLGMPSPHAIARDMIAGPNGLPKRVAECLLALGVGR